MKNFINFEDMKKRWMKEPEFRQAYDDLEIEFEIALELIKARNNSGLSQAQVAELMGTTQSVVARLESGRVIPSVRTLEKYAHATGKHLHVSLN